MNKSVIKNYAVWARTVTDENGEFKPDILKEAMTVEIDGLDRAVVLELIEKQDNEALFKYMIITQCNALNEGLPYMFEKISDMTELLFPANLLRADSIIGRMISDIPEEDFRDEVEIIGWLYQYYNSELKDDTFAKLKKNIKISKERIPAATQLFTPDWIVRYMVENSLGRLWIEGHSDESLKTNWKYYLEETKQEAEVETQLQKIRAEYAKIQPEDIKLIDPCMGSGHILVYAFDVLMQIYTACGYSERDAAKSILENNLYGLDIDDRAGQLAYFAVMMKARKYSRRILSSAVVPNVLAIQDSSFMDEAFITFAAGNDSALKQELVRLRNVFADAKEYGSILNVPAFDFEKIYARIKEIEGSFPENIFESAYRELALDKLPKLVKQAEIMHQKYDVVVTNPPYMGASSMSAKLGDYVKKNFPDSKSDLFAVFIEKCEMMVKPNGYQAMITQHAWMFLSSYEKLRSKLLMKDTLNMAHLGARAFEEIGGEVVQTTSFVLRNANIPNFKGTYCRLIEPTTQNGKEEMFLAGKNRYVSAQSNFTKIPGSPVAYWVSSSWLNAFSHQKYLKEFSILKKGTSTGDNARFIRNWHEVLKPSTYMTATSPEEAINTRKKWFPINSGGERRKWYGNRNEVVNWFSDGYEMKVLATKLNHGGHWSRYIVSPDRFFTNNISWSAISSSKISVRYSGYGFAFSSAAMEVFGEHLQYIMGLLNSIVADDILKLLAPTINFGVEQVGKIPIILQREAEVETIVTENIKLSKDDWDSYEISWDFKKSPLV